MKRIALVILAFASGSVACSGLLGDFDTTDGGANSGSSSSSSSSSSGGAGSSGADASSGGVSDASRDVAADGSSGGPSDAPAGDARDSGSDAPPPPTVSVTAGGLSTYVGEKTSVTASATASNGAAPSYSWQFASVPTGSALATLTGNTTATATFVPDVAGAYSLSVTAAAGSARNSATAVVSAYAPTVFYMRGDVIDGGTDAMFTSAYYASGSDGKGAHAVTCPVTGLTTSSGGLFSFPPDLPQFFGPDDLTDYFEPAPGQAARFAVSVYNVDPSGNPTLFVGDSDASCAVPPVLIQYDGGGVYQPRFNATASRLVFIGGSDLNIVTVNPDGSNARVVTNYATGADGGGAYDYNPSSINFPPRPQWAGNLIAWVREYTNGSDPIAWEIVEVNDVAGAMPQRYMACPGGTPRQFAILADGTVLVAYRTPDGSGSTSSSPENLYRMAPDNGKNCSIVVQYTDLGSSGISQATDFAVSPDGTQIAFVQVDGLTEDGGYATNGLPGGYPYVVSVDGGTPVRVSSDYLMYGPRWIGAGSRLVSTRYDSYTDGGLVQVATSVVMHTPTADASSSVLVQADGYQTFVSSGSNGGCSVVASGGPRSPGGGGRGLVWLLGAGLAGALRRGRKRSLLG